MKIHELSPAVGSTKERIRVGRGAGSGLGKTSGRGQKGQKARSGGNVRAGFEGGQLPLQRRLPKRGFNNIFSTNYAIVTLRDLNVFDSNTQVTEDLIMEKKIVKKKLDGIKILANGVLEKKLDVKVTAFSKSAKDTIEKLGGKAEVQ